MPQSLILPLHCATAGADYKSALEACICVGGCTSSRAGVLGACFGALATDAGVPEEWVAATAEGREIRELAEKLVAMRG